MLALTTFMTSCIDEDMSDCGQDYQINYSLQLETRLSTIVDQTLDQATEQAIAHNLKQELGNIFTAHAKDNDLSFYVGEKLFHHEANPMDASSVSYTIFLPQQNYRNLALANTAAEPLLSLIGKDACNTLALTQEKKDTIESHSNALFSSRLNIKEDDFNHHLKTTLHMLNAASAVVIDKNNLAPQEIVGFAKGMANTFAVSDSTYNYDYHTVVRAKKVATTDTHEALYAVSLPSKDGLSTARAAEEESYIWEFHVIVKLNGKYTENTLLFKEPLKAGALKIAKVTLQPDGSLESNTQSVGVSVKLDWKPGGKHDIEI